MAENTEGCRKVGQTERMRLKRLARDYFVRAEKDKENVCPNVEAPSEWCGLVRRRSQPSPSRSRYFPCAVPLAPPTREKAALRPKTITVERLCSVGVQTDESGRPRHSLSRLVCSTPAERASPDGSPEPTAPDPTGTLFRDRGCCCEARLRDVLDRFEALLRRDGADPPPPPRSAREVSVQCGPRPTASRAAMTEHAETRVAAVQCGAPARGCDACVQWEGLSEGEFADDSLSEQRSPLPWHLRLLDGSSATLQLDGPPSEEVYSLSEGELDPRDRLYDVHLLHQ